jgi:Protein of unknown function (DUF3822)
MQETGNKISLTTKIISGSFSEHLTSAYELFIFISENELSCAVADKKNQLFIALESWEVVDSVSAEEFLNIILKESEILRNHNFRSVICCSGFKSCTLVPDPLFTADSAKDQLLLSSTFRNSDEIIIDDLHALQAKIIFAVPGELLIILASHFRNLEMHHTATAVAGNLVANRKNSTEKAINIILHNSYFEAYVTAGSKLILYNQYTFHSAEEMVYYLLFICEQLHINPETVEMNFSGNINSGDHLITMAENYFRNIKFSGRPENYGYDLDFHELPPHFHFNLFCQVICAS